MLPELPVAVLWLAAGLVMMVLETVAPGVFLFWLGLAALGTGLVVQFAGLGFGLQVVVFAIFAAVTITVGLRFRSVRAPRHVNTPTSGLVGRPAVALEFHGRHGRVRVGDSDWSARLAADAAPPAPQTPMRVVGVDGTTLVVGPG